MKVAIIGSGEDKFTMKTKYVAISEIEKILAHRMDWIFVSGDSPVGGIDKWSERVARSWLMECDIKSPKQHIWDAEYGFKQRNLDIAQSDEVHVILVDKYPENYDYKKRAFTITENNKILPYCYHCFKTDHVKSGACWTAKQALKLGKKVTWYIINNDTGEVIKRE